MVQRTFKNLKTTRKQNRTKSLTKSSPIVQAYKIDVTTISHNNISENLNIHYVSKDKFDIGVIEIESPYGNPIKIYNAERCICDILKNKNEIDIELYNKIIKNYFKQKNRNLVLLEEYSRIFNIHEKFENIMEVLI